MFYLKRNLPIWERALRLCLAGFIGLGAYYFLVNGVFQAVLFIFTTILVGTALIGFCPAYAMFRRKTASSKK